MYFASAILVCRLLKVIWSPFPWGDSAIWLSPTSPCLLIFYCLNPLMVNPIIVMSAQDDKSVSQKLRHSVINSEGVNWSRDIFAYTVVILARFSTTITAQFLLFFSRLSLTYAQNTAYGNILNRFPQENIGYKRLSFQENITSCCNCRQFWSF